jgi:P2-related tail formation protein
MNLLPNNSSYKEQKFAELFDKNSRVNYDDLKIDVRSCHKSILPHIALTLGANIDNMLESEARKYLETFSQKAIGTVGAVKDAVSSTLDNAKLVECHEDEALPLGYFGVTVQVLNDKSKKYDERLFSTSKRMINENKNVRSKFAGFDIVYPLVYGDTIIGGGSAINIKLQNKLDFSSEMELNITGGVVWTV